MAANTSPAPRLAAQPRLRDALHSVAQVGAVEPREREEVGQVEQAVDRAESPSSACRARAAVAHVGRHRRRPRRARPRRSGAAQLVLDGREQVVGGLLDLEVGVARDAEGGVSTISMPGKSESRCSAMTLSTAT